MRIFYDGEGWVIVWHAADLRSMVFRADVATANDALDEWHKAGHSMHPTPARERILQ